MILVTYDGLPVLDPVDINERLLPKLNTYFREASFGKTWLEWKIVGPYTLSAVGSCPWAGIIENAAIAAADPEVFFPKYDRIVILYPWRADTCRGIPLGFASTGRKHFLTADGDVVASLAGVAYNGDGTSPVVPSDQVAGGAIGHEMLHGFRLGHFDALDCGSESFGEDGTWGGTCNFVSYGDPYSYMGADGGALGGTHLDRLGWLDPANIVTIDGEHTGRHVLDPIELSSGGPQVLKILKRVDWRGFRSWYYIENREFLGHDEILAPYGYYVVDGVLIRSGSEAPLVEQEVNVYHPLGHPWDVGLASLLLDMTPGSRSGSWSKDDFVDAPLRIGESRTTPEGITIRSVADANRRLTVDVVVPRDTMPPSVQIKAVGPGVGSGVVVVHGTYTIRVQAKDNRGFSEALFFKDGVLLGRDTTPPFAFRWDTTREQEGSQYVLQVKVRDTAGNEGVSNPMPVIVENMRSALYIKPLPAIVRTIGSVRVEIEARDDASGMRSVSLSLPLTSRQLDLRTAPPYVLNWSIANNSYPGDFVLQASAEDNAGRLHVSPEVTVKVLANALHISEIQLSSAQVVINGSPIDYMAQVSNFSSETLSDIAVQAWVEQGTARRSAGGALIYCTNSNNSVGAVPPGSCTSDYLSLTANDLQNEGTGTFVAGPARAVIALKDIASGTILATQSIPITLSAPLSVLSLLDSPDPFSPNGDLTKDTTTISGSFNHTITSGKLQIKNNTATVVRKFTYSGSRTSISQVWDGKNNSGVRVSDGSYTYVLDGTDAGGSSASRSGTLTVDTIAPVLSGLSDSPDPFRPSTDQTTTIRFTLSEPAYVTLRIYNGAGTFIRTLLSSSYRTTLTNSLIWNGKNSSGVVVPTGVYTYKLWAWDRASNKASPYPASGTVTVQ